MPPALAAAPRRSPFPGGSPAAELIPAGWELHKRKFQAKVFTVFKEKTATPPPSSLPPGPPSSPSTLTQAAHPFPTRVHPPLALPLVPEPSPVPPPGGG